MGTRSVIAKPDGDGWRGRYHHWDGYPSGLGVTLLELHAGHFAGDTEAMVRYLIDEEPGGWSTIIGKDFTEPKSWDGAGPSSYSARGEEGDWWICQADVEPSGAEWAYIITPAGLLVLEGDMGAFGCGGGNWRNPVLVAWGDVPAMLAIEEREAAEA